MGLQLKNAEQIRTAWQVATDAAVHPEFTGVLIRHAHKPADGGARCGLSPLGRRQVHLYRTAIAPVIDDLVLNEPVDLWASKTERNVDTLAGILPMVVGTKIVTPPELDLPFLGPNDEDLATCRALADELNAQLTPGQPKFTVNSIVTRLEEYGKTRVGEKPAESQERIRQFLTDAAQSSKLFIYSMNSPTGNNAVGVDGVMVELEALFISYEPDTGFTLLGRIAPEWEEVPD